jgi:hypothetical protein
MGRNCKLATIGEYRSELYRVRVCDTFQQYRLSMAALAIRNGMDVPEFLLFCAGYVLDHHRRLKGLRQIFRQGEREILAAVAEPIEPGTLEPESERNRRRQTALDRFCAWAGPALIQNAREELR